MNKVFLIGNLTRDPEAGQTPSGVDFCRFSIAVNRDYTGADGERQTDFFNCTAWSGVGNAIANNQKKGNKIAVCGSIQLRNYEDNNGVKRTAIDVIAESVEFLTPKGNSSAPMPEPPAHVEKKSKLQTTSDEDIPF